MERINSTLVVKNRLSAELGREPTLSEISTETHQSLTSLEYLKDASALNSRVLSYDAPVNEENDDITYGGLVALEDKSFDNILNNFDLKCIIAKTPSLSAKELKLFIKDLVFSMGKLKL